MTQLVIAQGQFVVLVWMLAGPVKPGELGRLADSAWLRVVLMYEGKGFCFLRERS